MFFIKPEQQGAQSPEQQRVSEIQQRYALEWAQMGNATVADCERWFARCFSELMRRTDKTAASTDLQ